MLYLLIMILYTFLMKILIKSNLLLIRGILPIDLDKINLDEDTNFDENNLDTDIYVRLLACCSKSEKCKARKKG